MDTFQQTPYFGSSTPYGTMPTQSQSAQQAAGVWNWKYLAGGVVACLVVFALLWFFVFRHKDSTDQAKGIDKTEPIFNPTKPSPVMILPQPTGTTPAMTYVANPDLMETRPPETKLVSFAFESLTMPGYVPDAEVKLVQKPAANPVYALVSCGINGTRYAIRWKGRYLTVVNDKLMQWVDTKQEPHSCFVLVPGYCGGNDQEYVMLRSAQNGNFLRADETGTLVCKDAPTANTAPTFCWKLRGTSPPADAKCGCTYDYNVGGVVCKPCGVTTSAAPVVAPPLPGPWPELIGWDVDQAYAFLTQKFPSITVLRLPCQNGASPAACPILGAPTGVVVALRHHPETRKIMFIPMAERVVQPPAGPLVVRA